ncbi:protection of telomeres protein 1-like [Liolophura sinensis]|uniref:protection of telomeres protein 1-like n=1 Tax=Liolophura sinensis TaxID=3198878 RepID=UPI003158B879
MTVTKLTCSKKEAVTIKLPDDYTRQPIADLKTDGIYSKKYIQGFVSSKWDLQYKKKKPYLLKLVIDESNVSTTGPASNTSSISVFCFGDLAKEVEQILKGNFVIISGFTVEQSNRSTAGHTCQVCVNDDKGDVKIWIVDIRGKVKVVSDIVARPPRNATSDVPTKKRNPPQYEYTTIDKVKATSSVNLFAVVKFFKPPYRTRGTDLCQVMSLVDPTCDCLTKLKCVFFIRPPAEVPPVKLGSIVRFHRLKVVNYNGEPQGNNSPGFSWLVFEGEEGASLEPKTSSSQFTLTDGDKEKVKELRKWAAGLDEFSKNVKQFTLGDFIPGSYSDIVVQVVSTGVVEEGVCILLRVWDGTKLLYPVRSIDVSGESCDLDTDAELDKIAQGFIYDVCLFDDHYANGRAIKPGDLINLRNLHAAVYKNAETRDEYNALQTVELVLHRGTSYGRGVFKAKPGVQETENLTNRLDAIKEKVRSSKGGQDGSAESPSTSTRVPQKTEMPQDSSIAKDKAGLSCLEGNVANINRQDEITTELCNHNVSAENSRQPEKRGVFHLNTQSERLSPNKKVVRLSDHCESYRQVHFITPGSPELQLSCDPAVSPLQSDQILDANRCMMDTATVLTAHQHIKSCCLSEVKRHNVPYKFRVLAKVVDYHPKTEYPEDLVKLYCPQCHFVVRPDISPDGQLKYPHCIKCIKETSNPVSESASPSMEYTFILKFSLNDGEDAIVARLWRDSATEFLRGTKPEDVLKDSRTFKRVRCDLMALLGTDQSKPWLECCIKSYSSQAGTCYQIFDTTLA